MKTKQYRKKPITIEAYQTDREMDIETLEGIMHASIGDYIITGVNGEQYPCKPDIFKKTYDATGANAIDLTIRFIRICISRLCLRWLNWHFEKINRSQ